MNTTIKWGIIGLGKIAKKFATALTFVPDAEIYAVASRSQEKATTFANDVKAKKAYGTYNDLINDPLVEVVYIATPHVSHTEWSIKAMQKGKAVLCDIPLLRYCWSDREDLLLIKFTTIVIIKFQ